MAHLQPLAVRFFWVMLATIVVVAGLGLVFLSLSGRAPPAVVVVVPVMVAGFDAGREFQRRLGTSPAMAEGMILACIFFAIFLVTGTVIAVGAFLSSGGLPALGGGYLLRLIAPFLIFCALFIVMIRVMMWFGGRSTP